MTIRFINIASRLHRDQRGSITIVSVFAVLLLTMLLGMVMNVGRHADDKIRMQNAADATAYSGAMVVTRGMNVLAFSNHLLCEVFAVTAFLREGRDRNAERYVPEILAAWDNVAPVFTNSDFSPKFTQLGPAIEEKIPREQAMVDAYGEWAAAAAERFLPLFEYILDGDVETFGQVDPEGGLIPYFQRTVVETIPAMAQTTAGEIARRHGAAEARRGPMRGVLWHGGENPVCVGQYSDHMRLLAADPAEEPEYAAAARNVRERKARHYLNQWNYYTLWPLDRYAKMSRFSSLWRKFTCGQLEQLINENDNRNLPFMIRIESDDIANNEAYLNEFFTFIGVVYRDPLPEILPGLFQKPLDNASVAYAEARVFVPKRRLARFSHVSTDSKEEWPPWLDPIEDEEPPVSETSDTIGWEAGVSEEWDLWNQHWTAQLVPATQTVLATILQTPSPLPQFADMEFDPPNLGDVTTGEIGIISPH